MKKRLLLLVLALVLSSAYANAQIPHGTPTGGGSTGWMSANIGSGGYLIGGGIANDGTVVTNADTFGGYILPAGTRKWKQAFTAATLPGALQALHPAGGDAVYQMAIAPSNSQKVYAVYGLGITGARQFIASADRGATWAIKSGFVDRGTTDGNTYDKRAQGPHMSVDPHNANVVLTQSLTSGMYITTDGGANFTLIPTGSIPLPAVKILNTVVFDPNSLTNCGSGSNQTCGIYVASWGNGVYHSTDGGSTWSTAGSGSPTDGNRMAISSAGVVFLTSQSCGSLYRFKSGTWTKPQNNSLNGQCAVATDPNNPNRVVLTGGGIVSTSLNEGTSFVTTAETTCSATGSRQGQSRVASDIPWLAVTNECAMSPGMIFFDPSIPSSTSRMWYTEGIGVWYMDFGASNNAPTKTITWNSVSQGIEQLVSNSIVTSPTAGPIYCTWDRPVFIGSTANPPAFPTAHGLTYTYPIVQCFGVDYATSDPNTVVVVADVGQGVTNGYTNNANAGNSAIWHMFGSAPALGFAGGITATTANNFIWAPNANGYINYSTDSGTTWTPVNTFPFPKPVNGETGWGFGGSGQNREIICADKVAAHTVYAYNYGIPADPGTGAGVFRSTDDGATWTRRSGNARTASGKLDLYDGVNARMRCIPQSGTTDTTGHLLWSAGPSNQGNTAYGAFQYSTNGGANWTRLTHLCAIAGFGFGKHAPGQEYPVIYAVGFYNATTTCGSGRGTDTFGVWKSEDATATWSAVSGANADGTNCTNKYPNCNFDSVKGADGDLNVYGRVWVALGGAGLIVYQP